MKQKIVLAIMLSVFLAGGTTAYGASNSGQPVQTNVGHHNGYHHNSCFSTFFSSAVKRAAANSTVGCGGSTTHHVNRVDCIYPQVPEVPAGNGTGYQNGNTSSTSDVNSTDYSTNDNANYDSSSYSNSEVPTGSGTGYQGGYHHSDYGHHGRRHH